jgi:hypothetical protein
MAYPPAGLIACADHVKARMGLKGKLMNNHMKADTGHVLMCDTETLEDLRHRRGYYGDHNSYDPTDERYKPIRDICDMAEVLFDKTISDLDLAEKTDDNFNVDGFSDVILSHFF